MIKKILTTTIFLLTVSAAFSQYDARRYDSLVNIWRETNVSGTPADMFFDDTENIPDSVYRQRLSMIPSVINLPFNATVKKYIVAFTNPRNTFMRTAYGLSEYYFPLIESELDRQGLPMELKMLPIIESGLMPTAVSQSGAVGLWQFMLPSGKMMGLDVNSFVDERMDPIASTRAACQFLKRLYSIYGDWTLAIAAYNCGSGTVNKALQRVPKAKDYWDIYPYLPLETRNYIPKLVAAIYAYTYFKPNGLEAIMPDHTIVTDTIKVDKMLHFEQVSSTINVPVSLLRQLNPQYKLDIIPRSEKGNSLVLPTLYMSQFVAKESEIYSKDTLYLAKYINNKTGQVVMPSAAAMATPAATHAAPKTYKVKSGDMLATIAKKHGTTVASLTKVNKLKSTSLKVGQILIIP